MSKIQPTWKSSLGQPPSWELGKCKWWSATLCGAAGSRWEWTPRWAAAEASCACREGRRGQRGACSPGLGAAQSKSTTERVRFTGRKRVKENHTAEIKFTQRFQRFERIFPSLSFCWEQCCTTALDLQATRVASRKKCQQTLSELWNSKRIIKIKKKKKNIKKV